MKILGIETSCDETACSILCDSPDPKDRILSNVIYSQIKEQSPFGGTVPEIAARAHLVQLPRVMDQALKEANLTLDDIDLLAVTGGPGLIGGVFVGSMTIKSMALSLKKPFLAVNHLEGHALTARLSDNVSFPYLLVLTSGGHCQLILAEDVGRYTLLGSTIDDAAGEAFDKVAKLLKLPYPGGPSVEKAAAKGDPRAYAFPRPLIGQDNCNFSFSGLKTAVLNEINKIEMLDEQTTSDLAASFQQAVVGCFENRLKKAFKRIGPNVKNVVLAGGVAANKALRSSLTTLCDRHQNTLVAPPIGLCTDNAAMIGWTAIERYKKGEKSSLDFKPRPRWPLSEMSP